MDVDAVVIGAGVVGLAIARELAPSMDVLVLEAQRRHGQETSSRNSGVIHAGLYYPEGSRKARTCVEGRELLYRYCQARDIPHRQVGKLIVATDDAEAEALLTLRTRAHNNGVATELRDAAWLRTHEPNLRGVLALDVSVSGIVDAHALMDALKADATSHGTTFGMLAPVTDLREMTEGWRVETPTGDVSARVAINAAGLHADRVAKLAGAKLGELHPWKGSYFALDASAPRPSRPLVYPIPVVGGLGIHLTQDLGGRWIAGPDAEPAAAIDYAVDAAKADAFAASIARYLPGIRPRHLTPDYAGVRPKRRADGEFADFLVEEQPARMIHLLGIESPGLTAALSLAREVRALASRHV
ncbi:MAG: NAD(P)/FAD-dependent oxidoreductase [Myxococcota bacterium]